MIWETFMRCLKKKKEKKKVVNVYKLLLNCQCEWDSRDT